MTSAVFDDYMCVQCARHSKLFHCCLITWSLRGSWLCQSWNQHWFNRLMDLENSTLTDHVTLSLADGHWSSTQLCGLLFHPWHDLSSCCPRIFCPFFVFPALFAWLPYCIAEFRAHGNSVQACKYSIHFWKVIHVWLFCGSCFTSLRISTFEMSVLLLEVLKLKLQISVCYCSPCSSSAIKTSCDLCYWVHVVMYSVQWVVDKEWLN